MESTSKRFVVMKLRSLERSKQSNVSQWPQSPSRCLASYELRVSGLNRLRFSWTMGVPFEATWTVCDDANCGKGHCAEVPGIIPMYKCECDPGWSQAFKFIPISPCTIPNCTFDSACFNISLGPPRGIPVTDICVAVNCGPGGTCKHGSAPFSYTCECQPGYVNVFNLTAFPCVKHCVFGMDCAALGLGPPPPASPPSPAPPADHDSSGPPPSPKGNATALVAVVGLGGHSSARPVLLPFDETQWLIRVRRILDEEIELCDDQPISVFDVPKTLLCTKPEAYIPQLVSLGPYHHHRNELGDMERYKLSAAKRAQIHLPGTDLQQLEHGFTKLEHHIRAHYHRPVTGWMMAIDVSFLLEFLQFSSKNNNKRALQKLPSRMSHLVDPSRSTSCHSMLLRDIVMLENQVPLFLLLKAIECRCSSTQPAQYVLSSMLIGFFHEVCTFRGIGCPCTDINNHAHLLDFLYSNMVPQWTEESDVPDNNEEAQDESRCKQDHGKRTLNSIKGFFVKRGSMLVSVLMDFTVRILAKFVASLPCLSVLSQPIEQLTQQVSEPPDVQNQNISPLLEEIAVHSVAELAYTGVKFCPTVGDLSMINFSSETATLHLPVIGVDINSEVVLRNLIAYEASVVTGPLIFARYVELMNGIIDTEEDAQLLRECGIILNYLKSDKEVAGLWNGMTRSVRLTRVPALDKVIEDLNRHYNSCWKVKIRMYVKAHVLGSRELLGCVAVVMLLLFMGLQVFCVAHGCGVPASHRMASRKVRNMNNY
ncbi:hypothetical protein PR202_ga00279 [Eleusine coracana subsp. coracana]|uniref:EGF-like domain-containing protein n=1 Tax=Eleusine coracana subsp. coracana TaxID=191504 RepID=A0AAV5BG23_ELECO|nr:hypothetical protein PR202_ga00279 [Eleusine coracana subsp. coracana]